MSGGQKKNVDDQGKDTQSQLGNATAGNVAGAGSKGGAGKLARKSLLECEGTTRGT